ncbi:MAG: 16S rRNA (guanine(527)-N(7))-methyltransferase RsmG [Bacteroidales bacterium]|nr:16S rRNA (guanine(527)-N(7))-methyltransferase RsmG [Bacteroidales bacterium]
MIPSKDKYLKAIALWQEWNARINVISRRDSDCIFEHHILHSLAIARYLEVFYGGDGSVPPKTRAIATVLDLGCGGGFPGIPLAMEWPEAEFTLCDSIGKKVKVAQAVADGIGLKNVRCVQARVEELPGTWDLVVSRAVAPLDTLYGWVRGKFTGSLVCLKGGDVNEEISQLLKRYGKGPEAVRAEQIRVWKISDWLDDEYFAEIFVIEVGKSYLCSPFDEKYKNQ